MIGFVLRIQINLIDGTCLNFEGSGAQEIGRANYFGGWPTVSISPKQLACSLSVDDLVQSLSENVIDEDYENGEIKVFKNSRPIESDMVDGTYDAYDFILLIKEHLHSITDIQSVTIESKEYNDFYFYRSYTYERPTGNYTCVMMGVTDSPCADQEDEEEFKEIANDFDGYTPTILAFSDVDESEIVQKERFYRDADEDDVYAVVGCIVEKQELTEAKQDEKIINTEASDYLGTVKLGHYPTGSGAETAEVEWLILDNIDDRVLLLSKNVIDFLPAHKKSDRVTWETCFLRKWLNADFLNMMFTEEEQQMLLPTTLSVDTSMSGILCNVCNATEDRVFLLSAKECFKYFTSDLSRAGHTTPYADEKRKEKGKANMNRDNLCHSWWIRNDGGAMNESGIVFSDGSVFAIGGFKNREIGGLRPAMWVNIELLNRFCEVTWTNACNIIHAPDCHIINGTMTSCHENVSCIAVPEGVVSIGSHAFENCNSIEDIILPESIIRIEDNAFWSCTAKCINIPKNTRYIGKQAFLSCVNIVSVNIPAGIEAIEESTFSCCFALEKVTIPNSVVRIALNAFHGCSKIIIYTPAGSYAEAFAKENGISCITE